MVFDAIKPIAEPAAQVHEGIAVAIHGSIRGRATAVGSALTERE
ncbi:hypothetical protein ACQPZ2_11890 [Nocardia pseudovaccinii]